MWVQYKEETENAWADQVHWPLSQEGSPLQSWVVPALVNGS